MVLPDLTLDLLKSEVQQFIRQLSTQSIGLLYGATDGKKIGTYIEQELNRYLIDRYQFVQGNAASGIDFPQLGIDLKTTSVAQPQSSCPFRDASQKIYGLGYHLIVLTYSKTDNDELRSARLTFHHAVFVHRDRTSDFQTTKDLLELLKQEANEDDIDAFLQDRMLPGDEITRRNLAKRILVEPPTQGYLTISNALQWRLQYDRVNKLAVQRQNEGIENLIG